MKIRIRKIDSQGRISLPVKWRKKIVSKEVIIIEENEQLIIKPVSESNLTKHFDSVEVDVNAHIFSDYNSLKKNFFQE